MEIIGPSVEMQNEFLIRELLGAGFDYCSCEFRSSDHFQRQALVWAYDNFIMILRQWREFLYSRSQLLTVKHLFLLGLKRGKVLAFLGMFLALLKPLAELPVRFIGVGRIG